MAQYVPDLRRRIIRQLRADLTNGRRDEELVPFTRGQVNAFVQEHEREIEKAIQNMIAGLPEEDLVNPQEDWIREFLYPVISYESLLQL